MEVINIKIRKAIKEDCEEVMRLVQVNFINDLYNDLFIKLLNNNVINLRNFIN